MLQKIKTMEWDFARSVTSMRIMTELGVAHGLSTRACLAGTGLFEQDLTNPSLVVSAKQELRLIGNLLQQLGELPDLGIQAGKRYHFTAFGALGFAMVCSPNARSALDTSLRYFRLTFAFTRFHVEDRGHETHITLDDTTLPEHLRAFVVQRDSAALVTVQRDLFSAHAGPTSVHLTAAEPTHAQVFEAFYGVRPVFGAKSNVVIIATQALMQPLSQANDLALKTAQEQCKILLDRHRSRAGLAAKVRGHLTSNGDQMPDMRAASSVLCMTPRTLRRRLLDEGTTFIRLRDEARLALAEEFLTSATMSVHEIAERLGYSDPTCFINAFKRWTGKTPLVYRKSVQI